MAAKGISYSKSHQVPHSFSMSLASAALEWLLIFLLFIHAIFSYLVTKFARCCKLQVPCLLCSRLDHVLGSEKLGFYRDLICQNHKLEISSLVVCHVHNQLVDVRGMCENCLFSFATINKSNAETYRLLVGKLGEHPEPGLDEDPLLEDHKPSDFSKRICSCCNEPWVLRNHGHNLLQAQLVCDDLKKTRKEPIGSRKGFDPLPYVEYTKVKISSDTESEVPFSDDDDSVAIIHESADLNKDFSVQSVPMGPRIINLADDSTSEKLIHTDSTSEFSLLDSQGQIGNIGAEGSTSVTSIMQIGHGLEEISWPNVGLKVDAFPSAMNSSSFIEVPQSSKVTKTPVDESKVCDDTETVELEQKSSEKAVDAGNRHVLESETSSEIPPAINNTNSHIPDNLELGDAYKLAVGIRGRQLSGKLLEQRSLKDSARISEDLKLLLSQISAARGIEFPLNEMSPRLSVNGDEMKTDSSSSIGIQLLQRRISLERNESGLSLDGSVIGEIEGESEVDRLKRQVEHDKKLMGALYKELEEERSASAISANQAMAMITRIQEEKAALQMEALQCVRMMEEQAEYDVEALQKANDLLAEKEKEMQDLEADLEFYRSKLEDASIVEKEVESTCGLEAGEVTAEQSDSNHLKNSENIESNSTVDKPHAFSKADLTYNLSLEFEDERLFILDCLKKLEKKLHLFSNDGVHLDSEDFVNPRTREDKVGDLKDHNCKDRTQESSRENENGLSVQNLEVVGKASSAISCGGQCYSGISKMTDVVALGDAVSNLIGRLEALELDHNGLDHSFESLERGNEELKLHSGDTLSPHGTSSD